MNQILQLEKFSLFIGKKQLLNNVDLTLNEGDFLVLRGGNGSGKSTLLKCLMGDSSIDDSLFVGKKSEITYSGNVLYMGQKYLNDNTYLTNFRTNVSFIEQTDKFSNSTAFKEVVSAMPFTGKIANYKQKATQLFNDFKITQIQNKNPNKLSGGQKKMVSILKGLVRLQDSNLFFIDEPLNNLDAHNSMLVANFITDMRKFYPALTILLVTHCPMFKATQTLTIKAQSLTQLNSSCVSTCYKNQDENGYFIID